MSLPINEVPLHFVQTQADKEEFICWYGRQDGTEMACDTETTGLQPYGPNRDRVRLVQFGTVDAGWSIPLTGNRELIQWALSYNNRRFVGHNAIFDQSFLRAEGLDTGLPWRCTYLAHVLTYPGDYHGLKSIAAQHFGREVRQGEKWLAKVKVKSHWDWATVPLDHPAYWGYSAFDAVLTARISELLNVLPWAEQYEREVYISHVTARIAARGLRVDVRYTEELVARWQAEQATLLARLQHYAVENPSSSKQLVAALENTGWEPDLFTPTGLPQVNRAVLEGIDHSIATDVLRWRRVNKWAKSYGVPLLESGGRIYPSITSCLGATGRMSISSPPLQQIPRGPEVRSCILAEEGTEMVACDYDGQELRLLAAFAGDPQLTKEVLSGDLHGKLAGALWGPNYTDQQRSWTKNALYAFCYGGGAEQVAKTAHRPEGEAEKAMRVALPGMLRVYDRLHKVVLRRQEEDGVAWARTLGGRQVAAPKSKLYVIGNYLQQGSGADILKMAMDRLCTAGLEDYITLPIHDEILFSLPPEIEGAEVAKIMETEFRGVPFSVHASKRGPSWGAVV